MEDIIKFNFNILNNEHWGFNHTDQIKTQSITKKHFKPHNKEIEREVGINVMKKKMPRSRKSNSMSKL